jgi:DNA helicase HerA-like ATPase
MYVRAMNRIFGAVRDRVSVESLREAIEESTLTSHQKQLATTRLGFAETYVGDVAPVSAHLAPGRLIVVDLRDPLIADDEALAMFMVLLRTFGQVTDTDGRPTNKIFVFDEAHKYMRDSQLRTAIDSAVRERRHRGTTIVIASQDPPSIPPEIVGLSNIVVAHNFTVPGWLDYLRKHKTAFAESGLKPSQLASLPSGEAFIWSEGGAEEFRRPQRVQIRPRLTRHGGSTRRATGWQG